MASLMPARMRTPAAECEPELQRRIERVVAELEEARSQMRRAQKNVRAAEEYLLARRLECEASAIHVAELADLLETLQQHQVVSRTARRGRG